MIKIKKTYVDFMKDIYIGTRCFNIELDTFGYDDNEEDLAIKAVAFSHICIRGEPFAQKEVLAVLCKKIQKLNPFAKIIIYSDGTVKPIGLNTLRSVDYIVMFNNKKQDDVALKWFAKAEAHFVFDITNIDFDFIGVLIAALDIKKRQVFIKTNTNFENVALEASTIGYNMYIEYDGDWYNGS